MKYKYAITYTCRPNKKSSGWPCAMNITLNANLDKREEQLKVLKMLSMCHRVNPTAIFDLKYVLLEKQTNIGAWAREKIAKLRGE